MFLVFNKPQEFDNAAVASLIEKTSLRKALEKLKEDLTTHKLPKKIYVSQLIKKAILCDNTRVAKVVQNESIAFLEKLIMEYPPQDGNPSVMYYKEIFEEVNNNTQTYLCFNLSVTMCAQSISLDDHWFPRVI